MALDGLGPFRPQGDPSGLGSSVGFQRDDTRYLRKRSLDRIPNRGRIRLAMRSVEFQSDGIDCLRGHNSVVLPVMTIYVERHVWT